MNFYYISITSAENKKQICKICNYWYEMSENPESKAVAKEMCK